MQPRTGIRQWRTDHQRRLAVLDDDPTGSQSVHDVQVVTVFEPDEYASALVEPGSICFVLTNTRSLPEADAVALTRRIVHDLLAIDPDIEIVSRSDSTLRGHVFAEITAIDEARYESTGRRYNGVLLAPAFFEAGRYTDRNIHWATIGGSPVPAGETEFARDATFGYRSSNLRDFIAEKSSGGVDRDDVLSIPLDTIRTLGADGVRDILMQAENGAFIVVNAKTYEDFEIVVLGLQQAEDAGRSFLFRTGPSFVRSLAGLEPRQVLTAKDFPGLAGNPRHGLVVVGSHVSQTSRQLAAAQASQSLIEFELSVAGILAGTPGYIADATAQVVAALESSDVLLYTSRELVTGADAGSSLDIARTVSAAVSTVVHGALAARPAWVIAKGGITSHDVAVRGLGMRRSRVLGQLLPGLISVFEPLAASENAVGVPYVVFAGNVGDDDTLAEVIRRLHTAQHEVAEVTS